MFIILWEVFIYVINYFYLAFKILSLSLTFEILIIMWLCIALFGLISLELRFPASGCLFIPQLREIFSHYYWNKFPVFFSLSSLSGTPLMWILICFMSHKSLTFFFILFLFAALIEWVPLPSFWVVWSLLLLHLFCYWTPLAYYS